MVVMRKLSRHGDTPPATPTLGTPHPAPLPQPPAISSFPACVIGGLVTDGLVNSSILASGLPARPPAQVGTNPAACRDGHPEASLPHCCAPGGHSRSRWESTRAHACATRIGGQPTWPRLPDVGAQGGHPHPWARGWCALSLAAAMPPWRVPAGAGGFLPSRPRPARVCPRNGSDGSAPLCRRITAAAAAASEAPARSPGTAATPQRAAGRGASGGSPQGAQAEAGARGVGRGAGRDARQYQAASRAVGMGTGCGQGCGQVSQPHRSSAFALGSILQPRSPAPAPPRPGGAQIHGPCPRPPTRRRQPEAAQRWVTSGPQRPPRRMEAWPLFKGSLVLYNLTAGDNDVNEEGEAAPPRSGEPGTAGTRDAGIRHARGNGHLPGRGGTGGPPQRVPFSTGMFWECPKAGAETVPPCALLLGYQRSAAPHPRYACPGHPDARRPRGLWHSQSEGSLGSAFGGLFTPRDSWSRCPSAAQRGRGPGVGEV